MPRPVHFQLPAKDPERAGKFYSEVFGWKVGKWEEGDMPYWLVKTGEAPEMGIDGGIWEQCDEMPMPAHNVIAVDDLDAFVAKVEAAGGKITMPRMPIPKIGDIAYCEDTEGNVFAILQPDPSMMPPK